MSGRYGAGPSLLSRPRPHFLGSSVGTDTANSANIEDGSRAPERPTIGRGPIPRDLFPDPHPGRRRAGEASWPDAWSLCLLLRRRPGLEVSPIGPAMAVQDHLSKGWLRSTTPKRAGQQDG